MLEDILPGKEDVSSHARILLNALNNLPRPGIDSKYLEPYGELTSSVKTWPEWERAVREDAWPFTSTPRAREPRKGVWTNAVVLGSPG